MRILNLIAVVLLLLVVGCSAADNNPNVDKVKVTSEGKLFLNGQPTTIDALEQEFARLKTVDGIVWYYRENPNEKPHPIALAVIKAITDNKLPIKFSETDFN